MMSSHRGLLVLLAVACLAFADEKSTTTTTTAEATTSTETAKFTTENPKPLLVENGTYGFQRRQDGGFDFLNYFLNGNSQQQPQHQIRTVNFGQQAVQQPQQLQQHQQLQNSQQLQNPQQQQQLHQLAQLQQQQQQQQPHRFEQQQAEQQIQHIQVTPQMLEQLRLLQEQQQQQQRQQQFLQQQQHQQHHQPEQHRAPESNPNSQYDDLSESNQLQQPQIIVASRNGPYGQGSYAISDNGYGQGAIGNSYKVGQGNSYPVGVSNSYQTGHGNSYQAGPHPQSIGVSVGVAPKPGISLPIGNLLTLIPRIANILSAGGKVMLGAELGKNFYFGPVGAKPLY